MRKTSSKTFLCLLALEIELEASWHLYSGDRVHRMKFQVTDFPVNLIQDKFDSRIGLLTCF